MTLIFGLDVGTTSIGFAVISHDHGSEPAKGRIERLGVRIFPEARDPKANTPLNQDRRAARLRRRHLRRRRQRRQDLNKVLSEAGLLPFPDSQQWSVVMKADPYALRKRAFQGEELTPHEVGRAIYHLAQRRHFKGRDLDEISGSDQESKPDKKDPAAAEEAAGKEAALQTSEKLKKEGKTLGSWLAEKGPHERKRGERATRQDVEDEFNGVWRPLLAGDVGEKVHDVIFHQRPTFWRLNTLGQCRLVPGAPPCPKGSWLSQQRRMLEKLNNLELGGGLGERPLTSEERNAILKKLQTQASMTWAGVRRALAPVYRSQGEAGLEKGLKFNLEEGGEKKLLGNPLEARLAAILGATWENHPHKQAIRDAVPDAIWRANYREEGQRVLIVPAKERQQRIGEAVGQLKERFGLSEEEAGKLIQEKLPVGWDAYSKEALQKILPLLEAGIRFGAILNSTDSHMESWRKENFPNGVPQAENSEGLARLPSPANQEERKHLATLRNPTVARARNELRKVVNNLIHMFGKPDLIRIELARDVGHSKREREEKAKAMKAQEKRREEARKALKEHHIAEPSREDIEKWLLWKECDHRCPYTGNHICFDALFHRGEFEVEHIWPRSRALDDSFRNKTLCRSDVNQRKGNQTPYECFQRDPKEWEAICERLKMKSSKKGQGRMSPGKVKRFLAEEIPEDFTSRQLNDTAYGARDAVAYLKKLYPDLGPQGPVKVSAVSGRVTAQLRRLWGLNNILADTGEKNRGDHRHHAIDALTVACTHPGMTQKLSRYWQAKDEGRVKDLQLEKPWETIRADAETAVKDIIVSHRVRKKVSGPLHKETVYGDTGNEVEEKGVTYQYFVTRKNVEALTKSELDKIRDQHVRAIIKRHVEEHGGDPKKAFPSYPKHSPKGQEIRKVRLLIKQQQKLMAKVSTGYADESSNHHIAIYRLPNGNVVHHTVSLLEASRRLSRQEPVVQRERGDGAQFVMSLSKGDSLMLTKDNQDRIMIVNSVSSKGQVVLADHDDAKKDKKDLFSPRARPLVEVYHAKKISVDPIGRVRPAND